ncbi:PTS transporter subunit EIIC [Enterococcus sp. AZ072]|uniref:PTS transporter subunit EIIC n=1 Tax=unclassified Enterococcus TaxID=2608891 RepID=UPI003D294113
MDYKKLGLDILEAVGGKENVTVLTHCATRLRFELKDFEKVDTKRIDEMKGVLKSLSSGGQFQVVIGPNVTLAYQAVQEALGNETISEVSPAAADTSLSSKLLATITGIFTPIIPAITAAGMVKAVLALLKVFNLIDVDGQTFAILTFASDAAFYFMPILLAASCAKMFRMSSGLAMMLAGILLHPSFQALVAAGDPVKFFGVPVRLVNYASSVIPIILIVFVASYVERFANKILPDVVKYIFRPLLVMVVMIPASLWLLGPFGGYVGDGIAGIISSIDGVAPWMIPTIMGTFTPVLVMFGLHNGLMPIATSQLSVQGYETIYGPGMLASNIAQGAASLAVSLKSKDKTVKQTALSTGFTALMGITEPAMYGITLRFKKVLFAVMVGGGVAGLYSGLSGLVRYSFGSPGLATLPVFIGDDPANIGKALITAGLSFAVTFAICMFIKIEDTQEKAQ